MQIPKDSGIGQLDKIVRRSMKFYSDAFKSLNQRMSSGSGANRDYSLRLPDLDSLRGSVESVLKGLNNTVSQLVSKPERTNYNAVVSSFLPPGARLLKPQYPEGATEIQFSDLDGDKQSELVTSYRTAEGIRTLILKKDEVQWYKLTEISHPDFEAIHYRNDADMTGDGKNLLILGLVPKTGTRTVFAYSLADGNAKKIFSKKYGLLELQKPAGRLGAAPPASLALWNETAPGIHDIELVRWNGLELQQEDSTRYLNGKVLPYYVRKLQQNPEDTTGWYNLANTMAKTGDRTRASAAVSMGLSRNPDAALREKFDELKRNL